MKIGFLLINFGINMGGAENNLYYLARELAKNHEVHIFCSGDKNFEEEIEGIFVHRSKVKFSLSYYLTFCPGIIKNLLKYNLDILHLNGFGFIQNDYALIRYHKKNPNTKIICTPHGPFMALENYNLFSKILKWIYMPFLKLTLKKYDKIIQVNPYQIEWLTKDYSVDENKIVLIPNGIPDELFSKVNKKTYDKILDNYKIKDKFVISYVGRINEYKGLDQVIRILPKLIKINPKIHFVILGKNNEVVTSLRNLSIELNVKNHVTIPGEIFSEEEKLVILDKSELFVFPSEWEAFGIVLLEAMARRNALVSSSTEGGRYLIQEGKNGYLFKFKDLDGLYNSIAKIIKDKKLLNKMQETNYIKSKQFLWKNIAVKLENEYKKL